MNYNLVTSKETIGRVFNSYNIKSSTFIPKVPQWVGEALGKLKLYVSLQPMVTKIEVSNYRGFVPSGIKRIDAVLYEGKILPRVIGKRLVNPNENLFDPLYVRDTIQNVEYDDEGNITQIRTVENTEVTVSADYITSRHNYILNGSGYLDTSFESGIIYLYYVGIPQEYDEISGIYYPLIPDLEYCKEAIVWYILMNILYSGYIHPLLSLTANNRYINPALQFDYYQPKAKNESLRLDREQRELHSRLWNSVVIDASDFEHSFHPKYSE